MVIPKATLDDLIQSFNDSELAQLSHLNLPGSNEIDRDKLQYHLERAATDWLSWFGEADYITAPNTCLGSAVSCEIAIARKRLDFNNPRASVTEDYEFCYQIARDWMEDQKDYAKIDKPGLNPDDEAIMSVFTV